MIFTYHEALLHQSFSSGDVTSHLLVFVRLVDMVNRRPREVPKRDGEESIALVKDTGKGIIPSSDGCEYAANPTSLLHCNDHGRGRVTMEMGDSKQEIVEVEEEKDQKHGNAGLEGA